MTLLELEQRFSTEAQCERFFRRIRWPNGVTCPRCGAAHAYYTQAFSRWECRQCRYQFSLTAHTIFHGSRTPLRKWFIAIWLIASSKQGISSKQLQRILGVTYKTAWRMATQIRLAMLSGSIEEQLCCVLADGDLAHPRVPWGRTGRGLMRVDVGFPLQDRSGSPTIVSVRNCDARTLEPVLIETMRLCADLCVVDQRPPRPARQPTAGNVRTIRPLTFMCGSVDLRAPETHMSLLKRAIFGVYHQISTKYLATYLGEFALRFAHRRDDDLFECILCYCSESISSPDWRGYPRRQSTHAGGKEVLWAVP